MNEQNVIAWHRRHPWLAGLELETEARQAREEGRRLTPSLEREFDRLLAVPGQEGSWHGGPGGKRGLDWMAEAGRLMDRVLRCGQDPAFGYEEPSDLRGIRKARPRAPRLPAWTASRRAFGTQLHGGLLGRICGCLLGKPVEGWRQAEIQALAAATGNWPLTDYLRAPAAREARRIPRTFRNAKSPVLRGNIQGMREDDDTNYTVLGFEVLRRFGSEFSPADVAALWLGLLPIGKVCTAERAAYRNLVDGIIPPESALRRNPYREWIGAQIRADFFGYANPGQPARAAEWAWRDACISHVKNGIYGEMWVAAMLAAAYVESDWVKVIRAGLAQIPARCRLRAAVEGIVTDHGKGVSWEAAVAGVQARWDETHHHDWCHTISNAEVVAIGMLYGEDDYTRTIGCAVGAGFDTDCNGATCGSLWGVRHGVKALPAIWTEPIADTLRTGVDGYAEVRVCDLARRMADWAWKHGAAPS